MLSIQQANEFLEGSPFACPRLQGAIHADTEAAHQLRGLILDLYHGSSDNSSISKLSDGLNEEFKGYALTIIANFFIYGQNDILFIKTAQDLFEQNAGCSSRR